MTGCGSGSTTISIGDKTPAEASNDIADAICDYSVECGDVSINCMSTENGFECTGTIEPVSYMECFDEVQPDIEADLAACNLTATQKTTVESCLNALLARPCITQAELDAYVTAIEMGDETATLGDPPPASCNETNAIFESCGE